MAEKVCQALIYDGTVNDDYFQCRRPAKAWIKDSLKRSGWGGRQYLCGIHARAHDKVAARTKRPLATRMGG
jgi:hypothetical protein